MISSTGTTNSLRCNHGLLVHNSLYHHCSTPQSLTDRMYIAIMSFSSVVAMRLSVLSFESVIYVYAVYHTAKRYKPSAVSAERDERY